MNSTSGAENSTRTSYRQSERDRLNVRTARDTVCALLHVNIANFIFRERPSGYKGRPQHRFVLKPILPTHVTDVVRSSHVRVRRVRQDSPSTVGSPS